MVLPVVTPENYYSPEMNMAYMGSTQFKAFERCEAAALAELKGEYSPPSSAALLVGGYIDAWFSGELPLYQAQHPEIFKRDGTLKAEYVKATEVVARLQADDLYSLLMSGKKQVIRTGTIAGVPFKIKIDSLLDADTCAKIVAEFPNAAAALGLCDGAIVDQKAMASMESVWSAEDHCKVPFVEYYGYDIQGAIYSMIGRVIGKSEKALRGKIYFTYLTEDADKVRAMLGDGPWGHGAPEPTVRQGFSLSKTRTEVRKNLSILDALLRKRMNDLGYDPYWQRFMCANWDPVKGCSADCADCDSCTEFQRIRPQYCRMCGGEFLERKEQTYCPKCRAMRKKQAQKKYAVLHARGRY